MNSSRSDRIAGSDDQKICGLYRPIELLYQSCMTKVWAVVDDEGHKYAAKLMKLQADGNSTSSFLAESSVFKTLTNGNIRNNCRVSVATPHGFPNIFFVGRHRNEYDVIVMELLSPDIYSLRNNIRWSRSFTTRGYLSLACEMLFAVMALHQHGFVHRNVKPQNFRIAHGFYPYLLDFSVAKRYINQRTNRHCVAGRVQSFVGTLKYASLNAHRLKIQSRRDDLISLGYSIIDIMKRGLPWDGPFVGSPSFSELASYVMNAKENISLNNLCFGLPDGILQYMNTATSMSYDAIPDYNRLQGMIDRRTVWILNG